MANPQLNRDYQRQRQMTLGDLLLENRIIFLQGEIHDGNANELVMKMLYLQSENRRKDINFYINFSRWERQLHAGYLRYDANPQLPGYHLLCWVGGQRGSDFIGGWYRRQAIHTAPRQSDDSSTLRPGGWSGFGY